MKSRSTSQRAAPRLGLPVSLALHICVVAAMLISWPHKLDIDDQSLPVVPVELVTLGDKTDIAPMTTAEPKKPEETPPEPTPPTPAPQPKSEPAPEPKAEPAPEVAPSARPKPAPDKPAPEKKKESFDINNIMALLDKSKAKSARHDKGKLGPQDIKGFGAQDAMTADLRTMLQSEIYKCWNPPVGSPQPDKLIVQYRLFLNRDGSIGQAPKLVGTGLPQNNPYMRAAIEAARRAIYVCAPYKLPANRYNQWQDVLFNFDPREMLGQ